MKLAVSGIAWVAAEDGEVREWLSTQGIDGIEIAPTMVWPAPLQATPEDVAAQRTAWEQCGLPVVAMQALLFGQPQFALFGEPGQRSQMLEYLTGIIRLGGALGAGPLVFGSPGNRRRGALAAVEAQEIAVDFFRCAGKAAQAAGAQLCIEPNPPAYGCDFVNTAAEGAALVRAVAHPNFRLHLDAAALKLNGEVPETAIAQSFDCLAHFHISEPQLAPAGADCGWHRRIASTLRSLGYQGFVSIEMRAGRQGENLAAVQNAVRFAQAVYCR
jgi:sugar phosphate isomerase/epimerase